MSIVPNITAEDIILIDNEQRIQDIKLAEALGYSFPHDIRKLIKRSASELEKYAALATRETQPEIFLAELAKNTRSRGRPGTSYQLGLVTSPMPNLQGKLPTKEMK